MRKQKNSEVEIRTGNLLIQLVSLVAVIYAVVKGTLEGYILLIMLLTVDLIYYRTVTGIYGEIKRVAGLVDRMVDGILENREIRAPEAPVDGVFSKICSKLNKLYGAKVTAIRNSEKEMTTTHELISDISHQVKTPVAGIKMYAEMLERRLEKDEELSYLKVIDEQANKLDFLMQSLIKMSRLETNIISLTIRNCNLLDILASALGSVIPQAEKKRIHIETECDPGIVVEADFKWTAEAIFNVLDNAVKYTEPDGYVKILAEPLGSYISLEIIDNGIGVGADEIPLIFNRFYRAQSVRKKEGLGLGLALSRQIITMENGNLSVTSKLGKGSAFRVMLPRGNI